METAANGTRFADSLLVAKVPVARLALAAAFGLLAACHRQPSPDAATAVAHALASGPGVQLKTGVWNDVQSFYARRAGQPAWLDRFSPSAKADDAILVVRSAREHGLDAADYGEQDLTTRRAGLSAPRVRGARDAGAARQAAEFDVRLTTALLALGRDVALGRGSPGALDPQWKARRHAPDLPGTLAQAVDAGLKGWLDAVRPPHPEYASLQKALMALYAAQDAGGWSAVSWPAAPTRPNAASIAALRARLAASGELKTSAANAPAVYDNGLRNAVRDFQDHHGLNATGVVDTATVAALNVPVEARIGQLAANLDRWRWVPDDFGPRHLLVNVPAFTLFARENGETVANMRVIVGKPDHRTPIFSAKMTTVVFSPYWNIPDSIAEGETVPAIAKDPRYLEKNQIEIVRFAKDGSAVVVDPSKVHWDDPAELRQLSFRQKPGPQNALGHVVFLFPNAFDVYLHDTPADSLFAQSGRALSHGCIRVEEPLELAKYVLRGDSDWDEPKIVAAMNAGVEKRVGMKEPIPVHIVYFTAWVDDGGGLRLYPDIYDYDGWPPAPRGEDSSK